MRHPAPEHDTWSARDVNLEAWLRWASWSICPCCGLKTAVVLTQTDIRNVERAASKRTAICLKCRTGSHVYVVPRLCDIPLVLKVLSKADVLVLRPFVLHQGSPKRHAAGYLVKDERSSLSWKRGAVLGEIMQSPEPSRSKLRAAYAHLASQTSSAYSAYIEAHDAFLRSGSNTSATKATKKSSASKKNSCVVQLLRIQVSTPRPRHFAAVFGMFSVAASPSKEGLVPQSSICPFLVADALCPATQHDHRREADAVQ